VPNAWLHCGCHTDEPEHYRRVELEDFDFPVAWDWYRYYCREYGLPDPGPCEPPKYTLEELHGGVKGLEERFSALPREELRSLGLKQLGEEVEQLRLGLRYTQRIIPGKPGKKQSVRTAKRGFVVK